MPLQLGASSLAIATFDGREHGAMFDIGHRKPSAESETMSAIDPQFLTHLLVERGKPGIASCAIQRGMEFDIERDIALGVAFARSVIEIGDPCSQVVENCARYSCGSELAGEPAKTGAYVEKIDDLHERQRPDDRTLMQNDIHEPRPFQKPAGLPYWRPANAKARSDSVLIQPRPGRVFTRDDRTLEFDLDTIGDRIIIFMGHLPTICLSQISSVNRFTQDG